ncbi:hypothetical protein [Paenibacillus taichungensis]
MTHKALIASPSLPPAVYVASIESFFNPKIGLNSYQKDIVERARRYA